jgi:hypothetical protein
MPCVIGVRMVWYTQSHKGGLMAKEIDEADIERLTKELLGTAGWGEVQRLLLRGDVNFAKYYVAGALAMAAKERIISSAQQKELLERLGLLETQPPFAGKVPHLSVVPTEPKKK